MDWESQLITLYLTVCKHYESTLWINCQRFTNGGIKRFADEEVMAVYLWGVLSGHQEIKSLHRFTTQYLQEWFPNLPGYAAFVHRVNRLSETFRRLIGDLQAE